MAAHLAQTRITGRKLGKNWLSRFLERHPEVASRFANRLDKARNSAANPILIKDYFRKLRRAIRERGIVPENTYNMDEKGFAMGVCDTCKVICRRGRKIPRLAQDGDRTWVTVIETVSAAGEALPPMIINEGAGHYYGWYAELTAEDRATLAFSPNGWSDCELGVDWLRDNFDYYTRERAAGRWRLLLVDGHVSHVSWEFFDYALKHQIQLVCLPSKSTHILQPLDVGLFSPLQKHYTNALDAAGIHAKDKINKGVFLKLLFPARRLTYTKENILSAWKRSGIHPFNARRVLASLQPEEDKPKPISIPVTPRTSRVSWAQTKQALGLVKGQTASAEKLRVHISKMDKALQQSITDKEIAEHLHKRYRQAVAAKSTAATNDRRRLTKARVITTEDVFRLKEAREKAEAEKAARQAAWQARGRGRGRGRGGRGRGKQSTVLPIAGDAPPSTPPPIAVSDSSLESVTSNRGGGRGQLRGRARGRGNRGGRGGRGGG